MKAGRALRDWHVLAALGVAVAVFFRRILLQQSFLWEDFLFQAYPFRNFAAVSLARGELPLWNPHIFGGMPFQADIQSALFYIPNLLLTPFTTDGVLSYYAMEVVLVAHYWLAGATMYYFARELELEPSYSAFSAIVFALSGFMIAHAIHPGFVQQVAWFPLIMLCVHRAIGRRSVPYALVGGVLTGHAILAGAPQISLYLFVLVLGYSAFMVGVELRGRPAFERLSAATVAAVVPLVAFGVGAIQLIPTIELAPLSERSELTFADAQAARLDWRQLITALVPKYFGAAGALERTYWGPGIHGTYWETCFYWGLPALFTATYAVPLARRQRIVAFLVVLVVLSFMLALGDQFLLHRVFYEVVPGFSKFRAVARVVVIATFAAALLAGFGLRRFILHAAGERSRAERAVVNGIAVIAVVWIAAQFGAFLPAGADAELVDARSIVRRETWIALFFAAAIGILCFLITRQAIGTRAGVAAFMVLQYADITRFGFDQNHGMISGERYFVHMPELQQEIVDRLLQERETDLFRVTARTERILILDRNHGMFNGLEFVDGYSPLRLRRSVPPARDRDASLDMLNTKFRFEIDTATGDMSMRGSPSYVPRAFTVHAATVIEDDSTAARRMRSAAFHPRREVILHDAPLAPGSSRRQANWGLPSDLDPSDARVVIVDRRTGSMTVDVVTRRPGVLVLSEIHYPGWRAAVDGAPQQLFRANWSLRAVAVPSGGHRVVLSFAPATFRIGATISFLTLLLAGGVLARTWLRRPRPPL